MTLVIERPKSKFKTMPEGLQQVVVSKVENAGEVDGKYGKTTKFYIYFADAEGTDVRRAYFGTKKIFADAEILTGQKIGEKFNLQELVGRQAVVLVVHVAKDGKTYANVTAVSKAAPGQTVAPASKPTAPAAPAFNAF
jgi:hypothetical protein